MKIFISPCSPAKQLLFVLVLPTLLLSSCKKYEDDDYWFTLKKPEKRLPEFYTMKEFSVNGADSIPFFEARYGKGFYLDFTKTRVPGSRDYYIYVYDPSGTKIGSGGWWLETYSNNKGDDRLYFILGSNIYGNFYATNLVVRKLTKRELNLTDEKQKFSANDTITADIPFYISVKFIRHDP